MPTVVLVGAEYEENLALRYFAASVERAGFRAEIVPFNSAGELEPAVARTFTAHPVVVGISVPFQLRARELLSLATRLRERGFNGHICIGGHFATFEYDNILRDFPAIDSVHRAEWDGTDESGRRVASGVYIYRLGSRGAALTRKMVLLK